MESDVVKRLMWSGLLAGLSALSGVVALAVVRLLLGVLAGLMAARAVKKGAPPVPDMAIEEARKIRETVSGEDASGAHASATAATGAEPLAEPGGSVRGAVASY